MKPEIDRDDDWDGACAFCEKKIDTGLFCDDICQAKYALVLVFGRTVAGNR